MRNPVGTLSRLLLRMAAAIAPALAPASMAAPAVVLFEDNFDRGIPGWTAVQPPDSYIDGPMRWQYDVVSESFVEQSNIYTGSPDGSQTATAVMLINDTVAEPAYTYRARLTAGDDDAFGLIFGYKDPGNFYRVTFTRQFRANPIFPWNGWNVDQRVDNVSTNLFGDGTPEHIPSFVNVQGQPFDVIIEVSEDSAFSLTVIDDPEGAAVEYVLVDSQPLPREASGQVGLYSWGMGGAVPRGFRIQNPVLEPAGLAGNPNALEDWEPVVTLRSDGSGLDPGSGNGGQGIWSLALGPNGFYGTLHENSDAFGGNDEFGVADFSTSALVTGEGSWSNYVFRARIFPFDDDGHGVLLRYQDEMNFYRVSLRAQDSTAGPRRGVSIQKMVGGVAEEIFHADPMDYVPSTSGVPYDITAVAFGDTLQVIIVHDPEGAAQSYTYGPIQVSGETIPSGRVGLFSWGMSRAEFDNVRVDGFEGVPLEVVSPYGDPEPSEGLHGFPAGSSVTASVTSPFEVAPGVRRVATGWTGQGSVPSSGTETSVTFDLNELSLIQWEWETEVRLQVTATEGGEVEAPSEEWHPEGSEVEITATANAGFVFAGWAGDLTSGEPSLQLRLHRPFTIEARFEADSDGDGLPDSWETTWLGGLASGAADDPDGDGASNLVEYRRGTNPTEPEVVAVPDPLASRWENVQRDPVLPGRLLVRDFGDGFRGLWEDSNDYRDAVPPNFIGPDLSIPLVSFEGPRIVIRTNVWDPEWTDFTATVVLSVADNDGNCVYFRYVDENNWYRVTICGENNNADWRAPFGVSIQKRVDGVFSEILQDPSIATDPSDSSYYKRVRITVTSEGSNHEVRVAGWNVFNTPPSWDSDYIYPFTDTDHPSGRFGIGTWGQSGQVSVNVENNPVNAGVLFEEVRVTVDGDEVFVEDWEEVPLAAELPEGWEPAFEGAAAGSWQVTGHGTFLQLANYGPPTSSSPGLPRADADGPILLAPPAQSGDFLLELGFHPFGSGALGFVFDFKDTENYSRVLFSSAPSDVGRVPQGVTVSRKSNGEWTDLFAGDTSFTYTPGTPFLVEFASNNGSYTMSARNADDAEPAARWSWTAPAASPGSRIGLTTWAFPEAHFAGPVLYSLAGGGPGPGEGPSIESVSLVNNQLVLSISNPSGEPFNVESSPTLEPGSWSVVEPDVTGAEWSTTIDPESPAMFFRLVQP